jgi:hypothetical protein
MTLEGTKNLKYQYYRELLSDIIKYYRGCTFYEINKRKSVETKETLENWNRTEIYYQRKFFDNTKTQLENIQLFITTNNIGMNYTEYNSYLVELRLKLLALGVTVSAFELRLYDSFDILHSTSSSTTNLDASFIREAKSVIKKEFNFISNTMTPEYYQTMKYFNDLFLFLLIVRSAFKVFAKISDGYIFSDTENEYLLNNFFLSFGFTFYDKIPKSLKANFALSLLKLYKTKGSYENIFTLMKALNKTYNVYAIYAVKLPNVTYKSFPYVAPTYGLTLSSNVYLYSKVEEIKFSNSQYRTALFKVKLEEGVNPDVTFLNLAKTGTQVEVDAASITYNEIMGKDETWLATPDDIFRDYDGFWLKTKYHYVENRLDLESQTILLSLVEVVSRYLSSAIKFSSGDVEDIELKQVVALLNSITLKVLERSSASVGSLLTEQPRTGIYSIFSLAEITTKVASITNISELNSFFNEAKQRIISRGNDKGNLLSNDPVIINLPTGVSQTYSNLMSSVDNFNILMSLNAQSDIEQHYEKTLRVIEDMLNQIEITLVSSNLPFVKIMRYFKSFYSKIIPQSNEEGLYFYEGRPTEGHKQFHGQIALNGELTLREQWSFCEEPYYMRFEQPYNNSITYSATPTHLYKPPSIVCSIAPQDTNIGKMVSLVPVGVGSTTVKGSFTKETVYIIKG